MLRWLWVSVLVIVVDQLTKLWANAGLEFGQPVALLPVFNLTLVYNPGAAFSFLSDATGWQRWFFITLALGVSGFIVTWLTRLERGRVVLALALALILGGALGNMIDRVLFGHVIDFIDLHYRQWHWPVFNVADSAITVGACLVILDAWRDESLKRVQRKQDDG